MEVSGNQPTQEVYKQEWDRSIEIFEKSFEGLESSQSEPQKNMYQKALKESLQAMQDSASALMNKELLIKKEKLDGDLQEYLNDPSQDHSRQVHEDLDNLKE